MKEALRVWQSFYCEGAYRRCERFKLATSGMLVPEKLLPNGRLVATDEKERPVATEDDDRPDPSGIPATAVAR
jgi:hypothetical protein